MKPSLDSSPILQRFLRNNLVLFSIVIVLTSCSYEEVEVRGISNFNVEKMDTKGVTLSAKVKVYNPNSYGFKVTSGDADIVFNRKLEGTATLLEGIKVKGKSEEFVDAKVRVNFKNGSLAMIPAAIQAFQSEKFDLDVKGKIKAKSFVVSREIDFDYKQP